MAATVCDPPPSSLKDIHDNFIGLPGILGRNMTPVEENLPLYVRRWVAESDPPIPHQFCALALSPSFQNRDSKSGEKQRSLLLVTTILHTVVPHNQ